MPTLVTTSEFRDHIGDDAPDESGTFLQNILDRVEDLLERETSRTFVESGSVTEETHDGTGMDYLYLEHPIDSLTEALIGYDPNDPDETLDEIPDEIQADGAQSFRMLRRDGGVFPSGKANIHVTYDHLEYKPEIAKQAVLEASAYLYRRRGKEHQAGTSVGEFGSMQLVALFSKLPAWQRATDVLRVPRVA